MTEIVKSGDCGNSPKCRVLLDLTIALARADKPRIARFLVEEASWHPAGKKVVTGTQTIIREMTGHGPASLLEIQHVVAHGKAGAVNGVIQFGSKRIGFCFIYEFSTARGTAISSITSYTQALPARA